MKHSTLLPKGKSWIHSFSATRLYSSSLTTYSVVIIYLVFQFTDSQAMIFTQANDIWNSVNVMIALRSSCPGKHKLISSPHLAYNLFLMNFTEQMEQMELNWEHQKLENKESRAAEVGKKNFIWNASWKRRGKIVSQRTTDVMFLKRDTECYSYLL